jgi:hypothetical protein
MARQLAFLLGICLAFPALEHVARGQPQPAVSTEQADPATLLRHGPAWRFTHAGWILLHLEGQPYERGYQHGRLLAREIVEYIRSLALARSHAAPEHAWRDHRLLTDALFLRRYAPELLEEMKGIADGAASAGAKFDKRRLDVIDIAAINSDIEIAFLEPALEVTPTGLERLATMAPRFSAEKQRAPERCSAFAATGPATADGTIVLGHITMTTLNSCRHYNVWLDLAPAQGHRVVMQTYPGGIQSGMDYYINSAGLIVAETTIRQTRFHPEAEPLASRIRRAVQYGGSIDEALRILSESSNGLYTNQWLLGDIKTNEIAMFELGVRDTALWRSSRGQWPLGTPGFYWGCNNVRGENVARESVADLLGKPENLVLYPKSRDRAWLMMYERNRGKIDAAFGFAAFGTPPLAAFPSCDAKFTTSALAQQLESYAIFGPPLGRTWDPAPEEKLRHPSVQPLVGNDWILLRALPPVGQPAGNPPEVASELQPTDRPRRFVPVDLAALATDRAEEPGVRFDARHPAAWHGTMMAKSNADLWLAAAFADYERVVSFELALANESRDAAPGRADRELVETALFEHKSRWMHAARRLGRDVPLVETKPDPAANEWYHIASGKGVMLLSQLRALVGHQRFVEAMDEFGRRFGGRAASTEEFLDHCGAMLGGEARRLLETGVERVVDLSSGEADCWTVLSFEAEPERALIVYGTVQDRAAQREAAQLLAREIARRFSNAEVPIKSDQEVKRDELADHHLLLVGRPAANRTAQFEHSPWPIRFGPASFELQGETYAHPETAVICAGRNPHNPRFSAVIFAGLGAAGTWNCVQYLDQDEEPAAAVVLMPARGRVRKLHLEPAPRPVERTSR